MAAEEVDDLDEEQAAEARDRDQQRQQPADRRAEIERREAFEPAEVEVSGPVDAVERASASRRSRRTRASPRMKSCGSDRSGSLSWLREIVSRRSLKVKKPSSSRRSSSSSIILRKAIVSRAACGDRPTSWKAPSRIGRNRSRTRLLAPFEGVLAGASRARRGPRRKVGPTSGSASHRAECA